MPFGASLLLLSLTACPLCAGSQEQKTVEAATEAVRALSEIPLKSIPKALLCDAAGVAVVPRVVKAGLVVDGRFGRGVILAHQPDGTWSYPIFVTMTGGGVGGQAGVETTELVLVFKTRKSLDRALRGKLTLGGDVAVAAGPLGRDAEAGKDGIWKAEVFSYSRSRGLFVGVSLEGSRLRIDDHANEVFYNHHGCRPADVVARRGAPIPAAEALRAQLTKLSPPPVPPVILVPVPSAPPPGRGPR
jgi:lipid-binding SYLF domain-containing protein